MRDLTGMLGQYVHGNETDRQVPYYYNYAGRTLEVSGGHPENHEGASQTRPKWALWHG